MSDFPKREFPKIHMEKFVEEIAKSEEHPDSILYCSLNQINDMLEAGFSGNYDNQIKPNFSRIALYYRVAIESDDWFYDNYADYTDDLVHATGLLLEASVGICERQRHTRYREIFPILHVLTKHFYSMMGRIEKLPEGAELLKSVGEFYQKFREKYYLEFDLQLARYHYDLSLREDIDFSDPPIYLEGRARQVYEYLLKSNKRCTYDNIEEGTGLNRDQISGALKFLKANNLAKKINNGTIATPRPAIVRHL